MPDDNELLTEEQTALQFGLAVATLRNWRAQRRGPAATKIGRRSFYRRGAINSWLLSREGAQRAEVGAAK